MKRERPSRTSSSAPGPSTAANGAKRRRLIPYVEVPTLTEEEKAGYRHLRQSSLREAGRLVSASPPPIAREVVDTPRQKRARAERPTETRSTKKKGKGKEQASAKSSKRSKRKSRRERIRDPDRDGGGGAETEDEADAVADLELDEPERFQSDSRLRKRGETEKQRLLRKLTNKRMGVVESTTEESSVDSDDEASDDSSTDSEGFTTSDDDRGPVRGGRRAVQLPAQFMPRAAQPAQFNFKVVFQYFIVLAIKKPKVLPIPGDTYFKQALDELRYRISGYKNSIRSQIWHPVFAQTLERYPAFKVTPLAVPESYCDACHRRNQRCRAHVTVGGSRYNRETHEPIDSDSDSDSDSSGSSSGGDRGRRAKKEEGTKKDFNMGSQCLRRAELFHALSHWEDVLFYRVRGYYRDLMRAQRKRIPSDSEASTSSPGSDSDEEERILRRRDRERRRKRTQVRIERLREGNLPDDYRNIDTVTEWMDDMGFQRSAFQWFQELETRCRKLEMEN